MGSWKSSKLRRSLISVARRGVDLFRRDACQPCICGAELKPLIQRGRETRKYHRWQGATIHRCDRCGHVQFAPLPQREWLDSFYGRHGFWDGASDPAAYISQWLDDAPHRKFAEMVERFATGHVKLHDFACGYGGLVKRLGGPQIDATGCDMSRACIAFARRRLHLTVAVGGIEHLAEIEPQDIITCYHAIEHLREPGEFFAAASRALTPGGILALAMPNGAFAPAAADHFGRFDWCIYPAHLHYFTPRSIAAALGRHGFDVIHMESISDHEPGLQIEWVGETCPAMTLADMDRAMLSRDLRVVARKAIAPTAR